MAEAKWDRLLEWMTHVGSGPWAAFRDAVDELDDGAEEDRRRLRSSLRVLLSDMGHADFSFASSPRWRIRRPALVGVPQGEGEHLFTGGRSADLLGRLIGAARDAGAALAIDEDAPGLSRVRVREEPARVEDLARRLGIDYLANGAQALASFLPSVHEIVETAQEEDEPIGWEVRSWSFGEGRWVEGRRSHSLCEYANRYGVRQDLLDVGPGRPLRKVERRVGMYCAALLARRRIITYTEADHSLRVPWWAPLPSEHARVACFAAGRPARLRDGHIAFAGVDPQFALTLLGSLAQVRPVPRISR